MNEVSIRVFEAFAGYGSQSLACKEFEKKQNQFKFEVVGISEIDEDSVKAYNILHGNDIKNENDITEIDWHKVPDFNLFFYTFPCQDISWTGLKKGFDENSDTRSSLLWQCKKAIEIKKPKYLIMENVKSITYKNKPNNGERSNKENLGLWIKYLEEMGYKSTKMIMNASDYGIPQHRERYILISVLGKDELKMSHRKRQTPVVETVLERNVSSKYYLK